MENTKQEKATITINSDTLAAVLKAVKPFVSKDETRLNMHQVCVARDEDKKIRVTATDGHTLCSVTVNADANTLANGGARYVLTPPEIDVILARCKANKNGEITIDVVPEDDVNFPPYENAVPAIESLKPEFESIGFNAEYLARIGTVQKLLGAKACAARFGNALGPARFDIESKYLDARAVVIIMPCRI